MKSTKGKVLVVYQNEKDESLVDLLVKGGYAPTCICFDNIFENLQNAYPFAIIFLFDNFSEKLFQTCKVLRSHQQFDSTSIFVLSEVRNENIIIKSFDSGVDYFITKPISAKLLLTKIDAVNRKFQEMKKQVSPFGNIIIDREKYLVYYNSQSIFFPPKEFELLSLLIAKNGKLVLRNEIVNHIWGDLQIDFRSLDAHIYKLRQKLGRDSIKTIKGIGYKVSI